MSVSKVIFGTETLIDITDTTAIAEDVAEGKTFLSASGVLTTGTNQGGGGTPEAHTITIDSLSIAGKAGNMSTLPFNLRNDYSAVVYNNEIHILGGGSYKYHYKWNGTTWTSVSTLPYNFSDGSAVVYNNEIHILGGKYSTTYYSYHYKWNGTRWNTVSTLPYGFSGGSSVVYNNEIHILGGGSSGTETNHYKWDGTSWTSVSTLPYIYNIGKNNAVVINDEIHILGGSNYADYGKYHYKWDGTSWTQLDDLPYNLDGGSATIYNNEIHILGGSGASAIQKSHRKLNNTTWIQLIDLPYESYYSRVIAYNNNIHILGGIITGTETNHYALQITTPTSITTNGIYNIVGSNSEVGLSKLISNLTANTAGSISVDIDMSATATADKIMQGYTAWANGVKLTGTASGGGGYIKRAAGTNSTQLTFSNLEIPYSSISKYVVVCSSCSVKGSTSYYYVYWITNFSGSKYARAVRCNSLVTRKDITSSISVSGSGNSITFTSSNSYYCFSTTTSAYTIMYC